jgi:hypothetical protein
VINSETVFKARVVAAGGQCYGAGFFFSKGDRRYCQLLIGSRGALALKALSRNFQVLVFEDH